MTALYISSYVIAPVVMLGVCLGAGLLVRTVARGAVSNVLLLPVGFATIVAVGALLTTWDATAELTAPTFAAAAVAGLLLNRRGLRARLRPARRWIWAAGAAAVPYAVMVAPAALSGRPTWTGYGRIVDIAHQFQFSAYLLTGGRADPGRRDTSFFEMVQKTQDIGYPGGGQATFGGLAQLVGVDLVWTYQTFLGITAAMLALSVYGLLRGVIPSRWMRAVAAAVAAQPNILVGYGMVGGFKELVSASLLVLVAALLRSVDLSGPKRALVPAAVAIAAALGAFNLTIVPWLGMLLAATFVWSLMHRRRVTLRTRLRPLAAWATLGALTLAFAAPTVWEAYRLAPVAAQASGSSEDRTAIADLGNLAAPMPVRAAAGVWVSGDYRHPEVGNTLLTNTGIAIVLVLAVIGLVAAFARREWVLGFLGVAALVALTYFALRTGPWIQLKAISLSSPVALILAFAGAAALLQLFRARVLRALTLAAAALVSGLVLLGNAHAYHDTTLAPSERMRDLEKIGQRFAGEGPTMYPAFEEYAEYFLRRTDATGLVNPPGEGLQFPQYLEEANRDAPPLSYVRDPDAFVQPWLQNMKLIVIRRGPEWSRPAANYELALRTRFHDVYRQVLPPKTVLKHVPLPGWSFEGHEKACRSFERMASRAGARARVAYVRTPTTVTVPLGTTSEHSPEWTPADHDTIAPFGPGFAARAVNVRSPGTYRVWLRGPVQRAVRLRIDGRLVGKVEGQWSYPDQWTSVATVRLDRGWPEVRVERGGGSLKPGDGAGGLYGPVKLELLTPGRSAVETAPVDRAATLCRDRQRFDWVELVDADAFPDSQPQKSAERR